MRGRISERLSEILKSATGRAELRELLRNGREGVIRADGKMYRLRSTEGMVPVPVNGKR